MCALPCPRSRCLESRGGVWANGVQRQRSEARTRGLSRRRTEGGPKAAERLIKPVYSAAPASDRPNHVRGEAQGGSQNRERPHQPQSGGTGRLRGPVQNQTAHTAQQTHEGVLRETGSFNKADQIQVRWTAYKRDGHPGTAGDGG